MFQFSNHDGDLRHRVSAGELHRGFRNLRNDSSEDEPPKCLKDSEFGEHMLEKQAAYDCVEHATSLSHIPILLK